MTKKEKILFYNAIAKTQSTAGSVTLDKMTNGVTIINIGADIAVVNNIPLSPPAAGETLGDSYTFGGNKGEIYRGRIDITFRTSAGPAVLVIQKIYMSLKEAYVEEQINGD